MQNHTRRTPTSRVSPSGWSQSSIESVQSAMLSPQIPLAATIVMKISDVNKRSSVSNPKTSIDAVTKNPQNDSNTSITSSTSSDSSWRPYSAPIGFARKRMRHRRLSSGSLGNTKNFDWTWEQLMKEMDTPLNEWLKQVVSSLGIKDNDIEWNQMISTGFIKVEN